MNGRTADLLAGGHCMFVADNLIINDTYTVDALIESSISSTRDGVCNLAPYV